MTAATDTATAYRIADDMVAFAQTLGVTLRAPFVGGMFIFRVRNASGAARDQLIDHAFALTLPTDLRFTFQFS